MSRSMTGGESSAVLPPQTARTETIGGHTELDSPAAHDCAGSHFEKLGTVARDAAPPGPAALTVSIRRARSWWAPTHLHPQGRRPREGRPEADTSDSARYALLCRVTYAPVGFARNAQRVQDECSLLELRPCAAAPQACSRHCMLCVTRAHTRTLSSCRSPAACLGESREAAAVREHNHDTPRKTLHRALARLTQNCKHIHRSSRIVARGLLGSAAGVQGKNGTSRPCDRPPRRRGGHRPRRPAARRSMPPPSRPQASLRRVSCWGAHGRRCTIWTGLDAARWPSPIA